MYRRYGLPFVFAIVLAVLLAACGGSSATDTPKAADPATTPTTAPTTAPTAAVGSSAAATGTRPASSATTGATGSSVVPTGTRPGPLSVAPSERPPSDTRATGSSAAPAGTRPASSAATGSPAAGSTVAAGSTTAGAGVTVFTDPKNRFSFSRPSAWTVGQSTSPASVVQFNTTNPNGVLDISTEAAPSSVTIETYLATAVAEIQKAIPDAQPVDSTPLQLGTERAIQIDYTGTVSGSKISFSQIFTLHVSTAYVLTLGTQPADIDMMKQRSAVVVQTWKFL
jgi:hypothetical protein